MEITDIRNSIQEGKIRITDHSDEEAQNDKLLYEEIFFSVLTGIIIEDYPDDKPYPSCLNMVIHLKMSQFTVSGRIINRQNGQCWLQYTDQTQQNG